VRSHNCAIKNPWRCRRAKGLTRFLPKSHDPATTVMGCMNFHTPPGKTQTILSLRGQWDWMEDLELPLLPMYEEILQFSTVNQVQWTVCLMLNVDPHDSDKNWELGNTPPSVSYVQYLLCFFSLLYKFNSTVLFYSTTYCIFLFNNLAARNPTHHAEYVRVVFVRTSLFEIYAT
jgi:hypothetical protein